MANGLLLSRGIPGSPTFYQSGDIGFTGDGFTQRALDSWVTLDVDCMMCGRFSQHEHIQGNAVLASVQLRAQDLDSVCSECSGYVGTQTVSIPSADSKLGRLSAVARPAPRIDIGG